MENWSLATMYNFHFPSWAPRHFLVPFSSRWMNSTGYENVQRPAIYSRSEAHYFTHNNKQTMLHSEQHQTGPCTAVCVCHGASHFERKQKENLSYLYPFKSICIYLWSTIICSIGFFQHLPEPWPETYWTCCESTRRCWMTDNSDKCCDAKKQGAFCLCVDTLNGMCVQCLWVSKSFFCSRLFEDNLHSRKIDPLFFVLISTVLQGRTLRLKGYY